MKVRRLCWLGVAAPEYDAMVRFVRDVLGLRTVFEQDTTAELELESGDRIQVFGPGHRYFRTLPGASAAIRGRRRPRSSGRARTSRLRGRADRADDKWEWVDFRAPDGNLYELASRR